jgi:hypothetical protein
MFMRMNARCAPHLRPPRGDKTHPQTLPFADLPTAIGRLCAQRPPPPSRASSADERMARLLVARYRTTRSIAHSKPTCRCRRRRSTPSGNFSTVRTSRHEPPTSFHRLRRARPIPGLARARRGSEARQRAALRTLPTLCRRGMGLSIV